MSVYRRSTVSMQLGLRSRGIIRGARPILAAVLLLLAPAGASAVSVRYQMDQRGDFTVVGNVLAQECGSSFSESSLLAGTLGACGSSVSDRGADIFWRADDPSSGQAAASTAIAPGTARSTAVLALPSSTNVSYARLYWGAKVAGTAAGTTAVVDRPGSSFAPVTLTADASHTVASSTAGFVLYQSSVDVTALVRTMGVGAYRISGVSTTDLRNISDSEAYAAWTLVVFYQDPTQPTRNLTIFDGLDYIANGGQTVGVTLSGFLVPPSAYDAKLGVIAYAGTHTGGDTLSFNGTQLNAPLSSGNNNFFDNTRSWLGCPVGYSGVFSGTGRTCSVTNAGDLPQLKGDSGSMSSFDLNVVNVTAYVTPNQSSATISAKSASDQYFLGAFITSITTYKPSFQSSTKSVANLTQSSGTILPGDTLQYTLVLTNSGSDAATGTSLSDTLPAGVTYVPGSLRLAAGPANAAYPQWSPPYAMTDSAGDDIGEYLFATRTLAVHLGSGASATQGGTMQIGESATVTFQVTVDPVASGTMISNQAFVTAGGQLGAPPSSFPTSDPSFPGGTPTVVTVDRCATNADCSGATPYCDTSVRPTVCVGCLSNAGCSGSTPICDASHTCRACTSSDCAAPTPTCETSGPLAGRCVQCNVGETSACVAPTALCDTSVGICVECLSGADCGGSTPLCDGVTHTCRGCLDDSQCGGATPACQPGGTCGQCSSTHTSLCTGVTPVCDTAAGTCVGCVSALDCGPALPYCNPATDSCQACASDAQCPVGQPACQPDGTCDQCSSSNASQCTGATPVCDTAAGSCVGCVSSLDCGPALPYCSLASHSCQACASDAQ
ncbi:MAG: DUF11 domain-containing protein [Deltaproteobacteria bacterium]|nr:DUF11 domain-containing protein [Deltaproteobacteria bacterium]